MEEAEKELTAVLHDLLVYHEDGDSVLLRNIGKHLPNCSSFHPGNSNLQRFGVREYLDLREKELGGSLVTTAWRVLRLRMEGTASRYGG
jgi:hypothetical protein